MTNMDDVMIITQGANIWVDITIRLSVVGTLFISIVSRAKSLSLSLLSLLLSEPEATPPVPVLPPALFWKSILTPQVPKNEINSLVKSNLKKTWLTLEYNNNVQMHEWHITSDDSMTLWNPHLENKVHHLPVTYYYFRKRNLVFHSLWYNIIEFIVP